MPRNHIWDPDTDVRQAGINNATQVGRQFRRRQVEAGAQINAEGLVYAQLTPLPAVTELLAIVPARFGLTSAGAVRPNRRRWTRGLRDPHHQGIAGDIWAREARGDALADWLVWNAAYLQLQFVLFANTEWNGGPRPASRVWQMHPDAASQTDRHEDHVHFEVAPGSWDWPRGEMRRRLSAII
jgi:hypothetical protein